MTDGAGSWRRRSPSRDLPDRLQGMGRRLRRPGRGTPIADRPQGGDRRGARGFAPEHDVFWLYPTQVHQAEQGLRIAGRLRHSRRDRPRRWRSSALAVVDSIAFVEREETLAALFELHVWTEETLLRRFHYRRPGLWVLGVRVFRRLIPARPSVGRARRLQDLGVPRPPAATHGLCAGSRRAGVLPAAHAAPDGAGLT